MTFADMTANRPHLLDVLLAPFRAVGRGLIWMAENNSRTKAVEQLNSLSDEELAALGTTRVDEVRRIFASSGAI